MTRPTSAVQMLKTACLTALIRHGANANWSDRYGTPPTNCPEIPDELKNGVRSDQFAKLDDGLAPQKGTDDEQEVNSDAADVATHRPGGAIAAKLRGMVVPDPPGTGQIRNADPDIACASEILAAEPKPELKRRDIERTTWASYAVAKMIGDDVEQSCSEHPEFLSHQTYTEILDNTLKKYGIDLRSAQIGAQLRNVCLSSEFNKLAASDPGFAESIYRVCGFFQPAELQMVALLEETAQPEPGSIAELRRGVLHMLTSLEGCTDYIKRDLRAEVSPAISPNDTEAPTSQPSTLPSLSQEKAPSSEKSPGLNTTSTDEPTEPSRPEHDTAFTFQWALATARWAIAMTDKIQRGSPPSSEGISQLLNESSKALSGAGPLLERVSNVGGLLAGTIPSIAIRLQQENPGLALPAVIGRGELSVRRAMECIEAARAEHTEACNSLNVAKRTIRDVRAKAKVHNADMSRMIAAQGTSALHNQAKKLSTTLGDYHTLVENVYSKLGQANYYLGAPESAQGATQDALKLAQEANKKAEQIVQLAREVQDSFQVATLLGRNAAGDARAAREATGEQNRAIEVVLRHANSMREQRSLSQTESEALWRDSRDFCLHTKEDASSAQQELVNRRSVYDFWVQRVRQSEEHAEQYSLFGIEPGILAVDRLSLESSAEAKLDAERIFEVMVRRNAAAEGLTAVCNDLVTALAGTVTSCDDASSALDRLTALTTRNLDSATAGADLIDRELRELDHRRVYMEQLPQQAEEISRQSNALLYQMYQIAEAANESFGFAREGVENVIDQATALLNFAQAQKTNVEHMAQQFQNQADTLGGEATRKTCGESVFAPVVIGLSSMVRALRLVDPQGVRPDDITRAQLCMSILADFLVIREWQSSQGLPLFAEELLANDRPIDPQQEPNLPRRDSPRIAGKRLISNLTTQGGSFANMNYGLWNMLQGGCDIAIYGKPTSGALRAISGAVDFVNGTQQFCANLQTIDGDEGKRNQTKECIKRFANNYPHWARVGTRGLAAVAGAGMSVASVKFPEA